MKYFRHLPKDQVSGLDLKDTFPTMQENPLNLEYKENCAGKFSPTGMWMTTWTNTIHTADM
jgi:hypothetical protein